MIDTDKLRLPLNDKFISYREIGKTQVGYVESHHVIREANNIFGFGEWSYNIKQMNLVSNEQKENKYNKILNYVGYTAIVTIEVIDNDGVRVTREDVGFGQGIDQDVGKAHEGATKEAVTDALKRGLRTFGDSFGLALYAKDGQFIFTETISEEVEAELNSMIEDRGINFSVVENVWKIKELSYLPEKTKDKFKAWLHTFPILKPCNEIQLKIINDKLNAKGDKREEILFKMLDVYNVKALHELSFEDAAKAIIRLGK